MTDTDRLDATCAIDFSTPIRSGTGRGVREDGTVDACLVQRSYLRAWCREHPESPLAEIVGLPIPDDEPTVSPVLRAFAIALNDGLADAERQRLVPYEERLLGTRGTPEDEVRRAWLATDWLVRRFTPTWLRACGLVDRAGELEALDALTSAELARKAQPIIDRAKGEAYAAGGAAGDTAWAAAWAAAGGAAWAAAWAAAGGAAGAAASGAAGAAASAAAWAAARAAAWAAAWAAAGGAAGAAASGAAWAAARAKKGGYDKKYAAARKAADAVIAEKLGDTIVQLREEAFRLFDDMIDVAVPA